MVRNSQKNPFLSERYHAYEANISVVLQHKERLYIYERYHRLPCMWQAHVCRKK